MPRKDQRRRAEARDSYPTVVSRLDQLVDAMGAVVTGTSAPQEPRARRLDQVLESLARGEVTVAEAAAMMKSLRSPRRSRF